MQKDMYVLFDIIAMNGCVSPRVALEMTHNRTANTYGGIGHNIAVDLKCEHANHDFQGIINFK